MESESEKCRLTVAVQTGSCDTSDRLRIRPRAGLPANAKERHNNSFSGQSDFDLVSSARLVRTSAARPLRPSWNHKASFAHPSRHTVERLVTADRGSPFREQIAPELELARQDGEQVLILRGCERVYRAALV